MEPGDLASHPWSLYFVRNLGHFLLSLSPLLSAMRRCVILPTLKSLSGPALSRCSVAARHFPLCPAKLEQILEILSAQICLLEQREQRFRRLCIPSAYNSLEESKPLESSQKYTSDLVAHQHTPFHLSPPHLESKPFSRSARPCVLL